MEITRRQLAREKATIGIYQHLLVDNTLSDIQNFLQEEKTLREDESLMSFSVWLVETTLQNIDSYQKELTKYLKKGWTFERLGVMEKAILLIATCELLESDLPKNIVINEAIVNAKRFCDDDSYKFINGVLSKII